MIRNLSFFCLLALFWLRFFGVFFWLFICLGFGWGIFCCYCCFQCWISKQISLPRNLKIQTDKIYICSPWKLAIIENRCCSVRKKNNVLADFRKNRLVKLLVINRPFNQFGLLCTYIFIGKIIICLYQVQWLYQGK